MATKLSIHREYTSLASCSASSFDEHYGCHGRMVTQARDHLECNHHALRHALVEVRGRRLFFVGDSVMLEQWASAMNMFAVANQSLACPNIRHLYEHGWDECNKTHHTMRCAATRAFQSGASGHMLCFLRAGTMHPGALGLSDAL